MGDDDDPSSREADHTHGWSKQFTTGSFRGMEWGIVLRDYPKKVLSIFKSTKVPEHMSEFLYWAHKHHRIDTTTPTVERKQPESSQGPCMDGCKEFLVKGRQLVSSGRRARNVYRAQWRETLSTARSQDMCSPHTGHRGSNAIPGRHIVSMAERTSTQFHAKFATNS